MKLTVVVVLLCVALLTLHAQTTPVPPVPPSDPPTTWVVGIGNLQAFYRAPLVDGNYQQALVVVPQDGFGALASSTLSGRVDIDTRIASAIAELCNHDPGFCAQTFTFYQLRWKP